MPPMPVPIAQFGPLNEVTNAAKVTQAAAPITSVAEVVTSAAAPIASQAVSAVESVATVAKAKVEDLAEQVAGLSESMMRQCQYLGTGGLEDR